MIRIAIAAALVALSGGTLAADDSCFVSASSSELGWLDFSGGRLRGGKGREGERFSVSSAPDGSRAVQHTIRRGDVIDPLGADTGFLYREPAETIRLSWQQWTESGKGRGQPGKGMSIMMGRGQAGGYYESGPSGNRITDGEGASYYMLTPVTSGTAGTSSARNGLRGAIGSANRGALGAACDPLKSARPGGDPTGGNGRRCFEYLHGTSPTLPTGEWVNVEMTVRMNDAGQANGSASYAINGRTIHTQSGVMWMRSPEDNPEVWIRWRMMYGGTPEDLPPPQDLREWYRDFSLDVVPRGGAVSGGSSRADCVASAPVAPAAPRGEPETVAENPIEALPLTSDEEGGPEDACSIWLCLGQMHIPECRAAQAESFRRVLQGKSPVPSFASCDSEGDSRGFEVQTDIAARIGDDEPMRFRVGMECSLAENATIAGTTMPRGCTGTYRLTRVLRYGRQEYPTSAVRIKGVSR